MKMNEQLFQHYVVQNLMNLVTDGNRKSKRRHKKEKNLNLTNEEKEEIFGAYGEKCKRCKVIIVHREHIKENKCKLSNEKGKKVVASAVIGGKYGNNS
jgi:hypothetical protein